MNFIKNFFGYKNSKFSNNSSEWKKVLLFGITLNIQPNFKSNDYIEKNLEGIIKKISELGNRYYLLYNSVNLIRRSSCIELDFRLSDVEGDGENEYNTLLSPIPPDIKVDIINNVRSKFPSWVSNKLIKIDDFPERGYITFELPIQFIKSK